MKAIYLVVLILNILSLSGSFNMAVAEQVSYQITQESELTSSKKISIESFWLTGQFEQFNGIDNADIHYASFTHPLEKSNVFIVPGRSESYLKYQELAFDLYNNDYNVFIIDHRGQGLSQRLLNNKHKGYVKNFDDYALDLHQFITEVIPAKLSNTNRQTIQKSHILAHSMGGAISARMLQLFPNAVDSAVLASPMIAINSGGLPNWLAKGLINSGDTLNNWFSDDAWYFIGQSGFSSTSFEDNVLTQAPVRYQRFVELYESTTEIQLGGVTTHWLKEALTANKMIFEDLNKLSTPILLLQSGADTVVDNQAQDEFCAELNQFYSQSCPNAKPVKISGAFHELFFERDEYRNIAISKTLDWFKLY